MIIVPHVLDVRYTSSTCRSKDINEACFNKKCRYISDSVRIVVGLDLVAFCHCVDNFIFITRIMTTQGPFANVTIS